MEEGAVDELFQQPRHPYTASLIAASPDLDKPPSSVERPTPQSRTSEGCPFAPRCGNAVEACWNIFPDRTVVNELHAFWCHNPL
jgi:oligopeptide/dipeptide ABC transporter ATP-binding protein